jgi:hypothetical protein
MSPFDRFDMQYALTILFKNSCVLAVSKRAGLSIAETGHVVRIATKCLSLCPAQHREVSDPETMPVEFIASIDFQILRLERAELLVDDLPNNLIALHLKNCTCPAERLGSVAFDPSI